MIKHLAIIPDGNRRYAKKMGKPVWYGHKQGVRVMEDVAKWALDTLGIKALTIYAFSSHNFARPKPEIKQLMKMFEVLFDKLSKDKDIHRNQVRIRAVGRLSLLPPSTLAAIRRAEKATENYSDHYLTLAIAYDGRAEIVDAVKKLVKSKKQISEKTIEGALYLSELEPPELIIRTSGEQRLSGFLLWNSSYAEFFFSNKLWPEFNRDDLETAIADYESRQRRFGH